LGCSGEILCILYAAKRTEDRRGSIPDQLRECRAAIGRESGREVVAEYTGGWTSIPVAASLSRFSGFAGQDPGRCVASACVPSCGVLRLAPL
jgi:hypothetical protein